MLPTTLSTQEEAAILLKTLLLDKNFDPHAILGLHTNSSGKKVLRVYRPYAKKLHIELFGIIVEMRRIHDDGLFELEVASHTEAKDYRIYHMNGLLAHDPYAFLPTFQELDEHLFANGVHYDLHRKMGARRAVQHGIEGIAFSVWAPSAKAVHLVSDFTLWDTRILPMRSLGGSGVFELFVPGIVAGALYKYEIHTQDGRKVFKSDPYALGYEVRPKTASKVVDPAYVWHDQGWMKNREHQSLNRPIAVYEVHLGSWKREEGWKFLNYRTIAHELLSYVKEMGFTHVELLPIAEHPLDESWGYQVTGYFAPTSRFGSFQDFQYFVDVLHQGGIGIIIDWVPGHFPTDDFALARFDGTALYEHMDPRQGYHPHWNTYIFNFGRKEVSNFLISSALSWLDYFHIDGLRVDAVASMLYLDYGRDDGAWIPNQYGGKENLEAISFLKHANSIIHESFPGVLTIAEESTSFPRISHSLDSGGMGFDFKWNMGWMNDTLGYIQKDPIFRSFHQNELTFGLLYAFTEKFFLVFSHDEVVHGKRSLMGKMPGDTWQQFANLRLLFSYMITQPGKKLSFMGGELGQWNEWRATRELEWFLLQYPSHKGIQTCVKELLHFYKDHEALWKDDFSFNGFEWVDFSDSQNSIISYIRKSEDKALFCIHNFTPQFYDLYSAPLKHVTKIREVFNSDEERFGGSGKVQQPLAYSYNEHGKTTSVTLTLPPLSTVIFEVVW